MTPKTASGRGALGGAMVEVIIATLLLALAASVVFGSLLTATGNVVAASDRETASLEIERLLEELREFPTGDATPGPAAPGTVSAGEQTWRLIGDACECYALAPGVHDVTARLPLAMRDGKGAKMTYTVATETVNGSDVRRVTARVDWTGEH